ncbi:DUF1990 family protein [Microbacterium caowuchunii]|jgi:uncharacterized protein (UPF0548 family)|uniref:DUF1990 family protein n=1 Tax=Microbacterium caowuchunii TaxID=2614638 RepID=UPI001245C742|nr:DUF1990 family protein [Microbacterium caowuchunii]QEW00139.1 DUF1990 family protein [Microbacterium caowuchunii]
MRRGTFRDDTVDYAAVGATQAADLLQYPPERSIPSHQSWKIGSGEERFRAAGEMLLSWHVQREAGLALQDVRPASGPAYTGVSFDEEGQPIAPTRLEADQRFDADGTPYVGAGMTLRLHGRARGHNADAEVRVIFTVEEKRRIGFALGTVGGSVVSGEESFMVDWYANDEVWFTVRAFDAPAAFLYRVFPVLTRRRRHALYNRYLRAMSPMYTSSS